MSVQAKHAGSVSEIPSAVAATLAGASAPGAHAFGCILERAMGLGGLGLEDAASLLMVDEPGMLEELCLAADSVKEAVFGPRVVLFAPLYLSNHCSNDCLYCGFRRSNDTAVRRTLGVGEAVQQAAVLASRGFKRLLLVAGEHPGKNGIDYLTEVARAVYAETDIRILHVNCAPQDVEGFARLKAAGYGVYQCFQETYHPQTYALMHPFGKKREFGFRLAAMDRALKAGFGDVGIGALLGLYDYRYDALATIAHSMHLEERFGAAAHTISVPRLRPASGWRLEGAPSPVTDDEFRKIVAVYRLAVPYAGVVVSTREPEDLREAVLTAGASQISAGSSTEPGGYGRDSESAAQFEVTDTRGLEEMMAVIAKKGLLPSLCTSCYRSGRQGGQFRELASAGAIRDFCTPNAVLSLKEYLAENPESGLRDVLERVIAGYAGSVDGPLGRDLMGRLLRIEKGEKDVRY